MNRVLLTAEHGGLDESFEVYVDGVLVGSEFPCNVPDAWEIQVDTAMPSDLKLKVEAWFESNEAMFNGATAIFHSENNEWEIVVPHHLGQRRWR